MWKYNLLVIVFALAILMSGCLYSGMLLERRMAPTNHSTYTLPPDEIDVVDTTEIIMDKRNFLCAGDIDLNISDIGVVSFTCVLEENKVIITANPQDIFITQYLKREKL